MLSAFPSGKVESRASWAYIFEFSGQNSGRKIEGMRILQEFRSKYLPIIILGMNMESSETFVCRACQADFSKKEEYRKHIMRPHKVKNQRIPNPKMKLSKSKQTTIPKPSESKQTTVPKPSKSKQTNIPKPSKSKQTSIQKPSKSKQANSVQDI